MFETETSPIKTRSKSLHAHYSQFRLTASRLNLWVQAPGTARDHVLGVAWITIVITMAFLPTILTGVPVASGEHLRKIDRILASSPAPPVQPPSLVEEFAALVRHPMMGASVYDPAFYWIDLPNDVLQADAFRHAELPLWNPYNGLGTPLLATGQTAAFFPLKLIVYLTSVASGYSAFLISRLWVAGIATYGFGRSAGLGHAGALLASTGYALSGFVVTHFHNVESSPATMLPVAFWAVERAIRMPQISTSVALGLALGLVNVSGHPESALFGGIAAGAFAITRVVQVSDPDGPPRWRRRLGLAFRPGLALVGGAIVGGVVTAIVAIPLIERMSLGAGSLLSRPPTTTWADAGRNVFVPTLLHSLSALVDPQQQYNTYVGPLAVVLSVIAVRHTPSSRLVQALVLTGIASIGMLLVSRESEVFPVLPVGLNAFYGVAPLSLCLTILAGAGLDWLVSRSTLAERIRPLALPTVFLAACATAIWELAHDGTRVPAIALTSMPLIVLTIIAVRQAYYAMHRTARGSMNLPRHVARIEASIVAAGTGFAFFALALWAMSTVYQTWLGQSASGTAAYESRTEPIAWTAKGRTSTGAWRLNIDQLDAEVFLPPSSDASTLKWWDTDEFIPVSRYAFESDTGTISFAIPEKSFHGIVRGAFHRIINPEVAWWLVAELAFSTIAIATLSVWHHGRHLGIGVVLITGASLATVTSARNPPVRPYEFAPSPAISWLQREAPNERVASLSRDTLTPNVNAIFGIRSTDLQDPIQDCRYQALLRSLAAPATPRNCNGQNQTNFTAADPRSMRILGASVLVQSREDADKTRRANGITAPEGFTIGYEDDDVTIYRLTGGAQRVRVTTAITTLPSAARGSLDAVIAPDFDPDRSVVLELDNVPRSEIIGSATTRRCDTSNALVRRALETRPEQLSSMHSRATITEEAWNRITIQTESDVDAFLSIAESYFPGWQATVDADPAPVCRGNHAMMAVPVPGGHTTVRLHFTQDQW